MQVFAEILHVTKVLPWLFGSTNCIEKYLISCHLDGEILTEPAKGDQTLQLELTHLDMMFLLNMGGAEFRTPNSSNCGCCCIFVGRETSGLVRPKK
jgi:hypothetical protein